MRTDDLIDFLAATQISVDSGRLARALLLALVLGLAAVFGLIFATVGPRPDLAAAFRAPIVWAKHGFTLALLAVSLFAFARALRPGAATPTALLLAPFLALAGLALVQLLVAPGEWRGLVLGRNWLACMTLVPLHAAAPLVLLLAAARLGAPVEPTRAGALAGLSAGALAAVAYALHCTDDAAPFVLVWYGLAVAVPTSVGAVLGTRLLRW